MKASFISTSSINFALRDTTARMQKLLPNLQTEMTTGRNADSGLAIGTKTSELASITNDLSNLDRLKTTNGSILSKMGIAQTGLNQLRKVGDDLSNNLTVVIGDAAQKGVVRQSAGIALADMTSIMNSHVNGIYMFGGENADTAPLVSYAGSQAQTDFRAAFQTNFGFAVDDPATAGITPAQMDDFITNVAEPFFMGAGWKANMSSASDDVPKVRIGDNITVDGSVSANEKPFQKMALGMVLAVELYGTEIGGETLTNVGKYVAGAISEATSGIANVQGKLGLEEERIKRTTEGFAAQKTMLTNFVKELDGVDPYEAGVKINSLLTQLEASYAVTSRIQNLSLMQYLR